MRVFFTRRLDENEELHTQLERAESDLAATQKAVVDRAMLQKKVEEEKDVAKAEACLVKDEREVAEAKCTDV